MGKSVASGRQLTVAARRRTVTDLRIKGWDVARIAKHMGMKREAVRADIRATLNSIDREDKLELLELEMLRVDAMREPVLKAIQSAGYETPEGELRFTDVLKGVEVYLKLQERVAKYTGLDATREDSQSSEVDMWLTGIVGETDADVDVDDILGSIQTEDDIDEEL